MLIEMLIEKITMIASAAQCTLFRSWPNASSMNAPVSLMNIVRNRPWMLDELAIHIQNMQRPIRCIHDPLESLL